MLRTTRWLLLFLLALSAVSVHAQRVLTLPDLSTLTGPDGVGELSVDPKSGTVYASGFSSRLSGVKANGLARLQGGVPDLSWRPTTASTVSSRPVFATSGELYFIGNTVVDAPYPFLLSIAPSAGSEPVVRFIPALPAGVSGTVRLQAIAGGYDHWLYFTLLELTGENGQTATSRIGRLDTRSNTVDSWGYALPARTVTPTVGADGSLYTVSSGYTAPGNSSTVLTRLRTDAVATEIWKRDDLSRLERIEGDARGRLYLISYENPKPGETIRGVTRITADGQLDSTWSTKSATLFFSQASAYFEGADLLPVGDELILSVMPATLATGVAAELVRLDAQGELLQRVSVHGDTIQPYPYTPKRSLGIANGSIVHTTSSTVSEFDARTLARQRAYPYTTGAPRVTQVLALPDGGRLIVGEFAAFYGGRRYRNLLRTDADGNVRQDWQVNVDGWCGAVLTPRGILLIGNMAAVNGVPASNGAVKRNGYYQLSVALVSLAPGAAVDPTWGAQLPTSVSSVAYVDADTLYTMTATSPLYGVPGGSHNRFAELKNGHLKPDLDTSESW